MIVLRDVIVRIGNELMDGMLDTWIVAGVNWNRSTLIDVCAERRWIITNTFFQHKLISWNKW